MSHEQLPEVARTGAIGAAAHQGSPMAVADVVGRIRRIQEIMTSVMIGPKEEKGRKIDGIHYGIIPGTPKPSLYQPGAELLCATFRIAPTPHVVDLSTPDAVRYRIVMRGVHQATGEVLGEGIGECSSDETKYRWVRPVCNQEWDDTPVDQRREKWMRGRNDTYFKAKQVRTNPADIANTILKMAYKRALISMTRSVLACSDIFAQDLEDLPEEVRENVAAEEGQAQPPIKQPQKKEAAEAAKPEAKADAKTDAKTDAQPAVERPAYEAGSTYKLKALHEPEGKAYVLIGAANGFVCYAFKKEDAAAIGAAREALEVGLPVTITAVRTKWEAYPWRATAITLIEREPGAEG